MLMKLTLETLYKDHDNLRRILCLLEKLLIDIYRGYSENYLMLQRILIYIQDYPSHIHHPAEYAVFSTISKEGGSNNKFHEDVNTLMEDHSEIDDIIRTALEAMKLIRVREGLSHPVLSPLGCQGVRVLASLMLTIRTTDREVFFTSPK